MSGNGNGNGGQMVVAVPNPRAAGTVARQTGTGQELEFRGETAAAALAERARAGVEARFVMARRFPRDMDLVRVKLLKACQSPAFAEVAIYHKPIGKDGVRGPSIRMAEEISRCMGNIATEVSTVYDDPYRSILEVSATDLEINLTHPLTVLVQKTVERSEVREGRVVRAQRVNTFGDPVYIVDATDDEMLNKTAALTSKALRTCILRLAPDSLLAEAMATAMRTRAAEDAKDPDAARKSVIDGFVSLGVGPDRLIEYLGHPLDQLTPKEVNELRGLYAAIRDGEATWQEAIDHALARRQAAEPAPAAPANLAEAAARSKAAREGKQGSQTAAPEPAAQQAPSGPAEQPAAAEGKKLQVIVEGQPAPGNPEGSKTGK